MSTPDDALRKHVQRQLELEHRAMEAMCLCGCDLCGRRMVDFEGDTPVRPRGVVVQGPDGSYPCCFQCMEAVQAAQQEMRQ